MLSYRFIYNIFYSTLGEETEKPVPVVAHLSVCVFLYIYIYLCIYKHIRIHTEELMQALGFSLCVYICA